MSSNGWNVYLNGKLIDTVFFDEDCEEDYVYKALVNHDGYDSKIEIKKSKYTVKGGTPHHV